MAVVVMDVDDRAIAEAYADKWWLFLISGILWLLLGFIVLSLRPASISVCVILIAVAFWLGAVTQFALGDGDDRWLARAHDRQRHPRRRPPASPRSCGRARRWS